MWTYLLGWTLVSIVLAPLVGRLLARQHPHTFAEARHARRSAKPLIPAQRTAEATVPSQWRIPRQTHFVRDEPH